MKNIIFIIVLFQSVYIFGQSKKPEDFGFKHLSILYQKDSVDILLKSKKAEELKPKPLLFFCQGSLPVPLLIAEGGQIYPPFPFDVEKICENYHLVIVSKPHIPVLLDRKDLQPNFAYCEEKTNLPPKEYIIKNYLEYYVNRNLAVIEYLCKQEFIDKKKVVVAGHSQGARVAFEMALHSNLITHLIYSGGNPCGQIMSMVAQSRAVEYRADSISYAENDFQLFEEVMKDSSNIDPSYGDTFKSLYSFSKSSIHSFPLLKIPVLVCYGTKDASCPYNDYLRAELIRKGKKNVKFQSYIGLDHNFFGYKPNGEIDYDNFNWDKVANDWDAWLKEN